MKRLIDTDALLKAVANANIESPEDAMEIIDHAPDAQPEPKTAHWVPLDERFASWSSYYKCSECGFRINLRTATDFSGQSVNYCPHCGLQMKEDEK